LVHESFGRHSTVRIRSGAGAPSDIKRACQTADNDRKIIRAGVDKEQDN